MKTLTNIIIACLLIMTASCSKKADEPQQCKTCAARQGPEGTTIETKEVCTDDEEAAFKRTYVEFTVACE